MTPLGLAVALGYDDVADVLLANGASVTIGPELSRTLNTQPSLNVMLKKKEGQTLDPLLYAAALGQLKMAELLIVKGADVNATDERILNFIIFILFLG